MKYYHIHFLFIFATITIILMPILAIHIYNVQSSSIIAVHMNITGSYNTVELLAPENDSVFVKGDVIIFKWTSIANASNYTLMLDRNKDFNTSELLKIDGITGTEYNLSTDDMALGRWYWCVASVYDNGTVMYSDVWIIHIDPKRTPPGMISILDVLFAMFLGPIPLLVIAVILKRRKGKESK